MFYVLWGVVLVYLIPFLDRRLKANPSSVPARSDFFDVVVNWLLAIAMWAIGAQVLFQAGREMIVKKRLPTVVPLPSESDPGATTVPMPASSANTPRLHRGLMVALFVMTAFVLTVRYLGVDPALPPDLKTILAYASSTCSAVLVAVALIVFKPRVPGRRPDQSISQYWSTPDVATNVSLVWMLVDSGGVVAVLGYFLTGTLLSAITVGLTIATFWLYGPNRFAKEERVPKAAAT